MNYTKEEATVKKHSQAWIIQQARAALNEKGISGLCFDSLPRNMGEMYTTKDASEIIQRIIDDTLYAQRQFS